MWFWGGKVGDQLHLHVRSGSLHTIQFMISCTLLALNKELKARKINLGIYMKLEEDKEKFHKYLNDFRQGKKRRLSFKIPENLTDITSEPYNHTPKEKVLKHIDSLSY